MWFNHLLDYTNVSFDCFGQILFHIELLTTQYLVIGLRRLINIAMLEKLK